MVWIASRTDLDGHLPNHLGDHYYLKFQRTAAESYTAALFLSFIAMLSKENTFMAPLLLLSLEYFSASKREHQIGDPAAARFYASGRRDIRLSVDRPRRNRRICGSEWEFRRVQAGIQNDGRSVPASAFATIARFQLVRDQRHLGRRHRVIDHRGDDSSRLPLYPAPSNKEVGRFCLAWILIGYLPAHFLILIGPGLTNSRILYLSSVGLAILLSVMLSGIERAATRKALKLALILLLSLGLSHNVAAWRRVGDLSREFQTELKRLVPDPPPDAVFVFSQKPPYIEGIFYHGALHPAVNLNYDRTDLGAILWEDAFPESRPGAINLTGRPVIKVKWIGESEWRDRTYEGLRRRLARPVAVFLASIER